MFIIDDLLLAGPVLFMAARAYKSRRDEMESQATRSQPTEKTAGGCGNYAENIMDSTCGNYGDATLLYNNPIPNMREELGINPLFGILNDPGDDSQPFNFAVKKPDYSHAQPVKVVNGPGDDAYHGPYDGRSFDGVPPGFENAREVFVEPETRRRSRAQGPAKPTSDQTNIVRRGILEAVRSGIHDMPSWTQIKAGEYDLVVMNEPISVRGLRLPTSMDDAIEISKIMGVLPITPAISDARYQQAQRIHAKLFVKAANGNDPEQVVAYNAIIGPNTGNLVDGYWKELVLVPKLQPKGKGSMAQYGFKDSDSHMFEHGGVSNHDSKYKDYSLTPTYVSRMALKNGQVVDLLDELAGGSSLGGPLPAWLVDRLRGSSEITEVA